MFFRQFRDMHIRDQLDTLQQDEALLSVDPTTILVELDPTEPEEEDEEEEEEEEEDFIDELEDEDPVLPTFKESDPPLWL